MVYGCLTHKITSHVLVLSMLLCSWHMIPVMEIKNLLF